MSLVISHRLDPFRCLQFKKNKTGQPSFKKKPSIQFSHDYSQIIYLIENTFMCYGNPSDPLYIFSDNSLAKQHVL